jgi:hypothetical protein
MSDIDIGKLLADPEFLLDNVLLKLTTSQNVPAYSESQIRAIAGHLESLNFSIRFLKARLKKNPANESALKRLNSSVKDNYLSTFDKSGMTNKQLLLANAFIRDIMTQKVSDLKNDIMYLDDIPILKDEVDPADINETQFARIQAKTTQSGDDFPVLTDVIIEPIKIDDIIKQSIEIQKSIKKLSGDALDIFVRDVLTPMYTENVAELGARINGVKSTLRLRQIDQDDLIKHAEFIKGQIKIANQKIKAKEPVRDAKLTPDAVTSRSQQTENKPQESRLTSWFRDSWALSATLVKRVATATAVFLGGGAAVSLAAAFAISTQSPPEAPKEPETIRITFTAAADSVATAQANVEPPPPVAVAAAAPVAKIAKPVVLAKPASSVQESFDTNNYLFIPATIDGVKLQKMSSDTIERMCKSNIQTWVCPKTPENI